MPSKTPFYLALILLCTLVFGIMGSALAFHPSAASSPSGYSLSNVSTYNQYGQFFVNETLTGASNATSLNSVTFGFPGSYQGHVEAITASAQQGGSSVSTTSSTSVSNGTLQVTLSFASSLGGPNSTASLGFWVLNTLTAIDANGDFNASILFSPFVSIQLQSMYSAIIFPYTYTSASNTTQLMDAGFSQTVTDTQQIWNLTSSTPNSNLNAFTTEITSTPDSSGSIDFTSITRQLSIAASGQVTVKDTINLFNHGLNTISELNYIPLTNAGNLTAVPANEPPLSNVAEISISSDVIGLNSTNQAIQPNSAATLIIEYPLSSQYWKVSNGIYNVTIPTTVPVESIVDQYKISTTSVPGVIVSGKAISESASYVNETGSDSLSMQYRVGIASASADALPVAAILFIGVFVAGIVFRPKSEIEGTGSAFDNLVKAVEEKVSSTNELLSELKPKGTAITRNDLVLTRTRVEEVRTKTNSRIGQIRSQLPGVTTSVQAGINDVLATDREFDKVVRDILNTYDQLISKRMKEDTFHRVQQANERRLQNQMNALIDKSHDAREEYESEG